MTYPIKTKEYQTVCLKGNLEEMGVYFYINKVCMWGGVGGRVGILLYSFLGRPIVALMCIAKQYPLPTLQAVLDKQ